MAYKTIKLKSYTDVQEEYVLAAAATPGHFLEVTSAGKVQVHSTAGGNVLPMVALEDELQGGEISDAFEAADRVQAWIPQRGDQVYAILADGENVAIGDFLESAGDGTVQAHTADDSTAANTTNQIIGVALEAVDMSGSSTVDPSPRIAIRIV